jgi:hypothetical protein
VIYGSWTEVKCLPSPDGRRKVIVVRNRDGLFKYEALRWQRYYEPSPADQGPIEGGLWGEEYVSGLFASAADAEADARTAIEWLRAA